MKPSSLIPIFDRLPITFEHGKGSWLFDSNNKKYLDAITGIGVNSLGYAHPRILEAVTEQAKKIIHIGNSYIIEEQEALGHEFTQYAGMDKVIFVNSGTESSEVSFKMARLYGHLKGIQEPTLIVFNNGFHGRTMGSLSASGNFALQDGFAPLLKGFVFVPFNDIEAVKKIAATNKNIVGISLEPIQGQGGVVVPNPDYLMQLRKICDEHNWLLILDEIQTGMGRTGKNFAYQHDALRPDILTTAKCLANGLPIGACATTNAIASIFTLGKHGTTFGGNPLSCHVARTIIKIYAEENIMQNVIEVGNYLLAQLHDVFDHDPNIIDVRGKGMMIGIELDRPCDNLYLKCLDEGLLINIAAKKVIRLLPPYILTKEEADILVNKLQTAIKKFYQSKSREESVNG